MDRQYKHIAEPIIREGKVLWAEERIQIAMQIVWGKNRLNLKERGELKKLRESMTPFAVK